jgi:hypothetical protein
MPGKSKSFKASISIENPAMRFISTPAEPAPADDAPQPPEGFKRNPLYIETKSRRLQLLMQPSLYEKIKARSAEQGVSVNELVHSLLEEAVK